MRSVRVAPLRWGPRKEAAIVALGLACFSLPLLWPDLFFPLTWGSFVFLVEPWNRRHAERSFLRDLERGRPPRSCGRSLAGLACGLLWETWNYWARTKWIYTVPGFEQVKLFEMPLAGFLGFPPFAVECLVVIRAAQALAGRARPPGPARAAVVAAAGLAATLLVFRAVDPVTVDSFHRPTAELAVLPAPARQRLAELGLDSPEKLLRALESLEDRAAWSARSGLSAAELDRIRSTVALVMHRGLGDDRAAQLRRLGIESVTDLRRWDSAALAAALRAQGATPRDRFLERRARVWLD